MAASAMKFPTYGANLVIDEATVVRYSASLKGLTLEQSKLALSTTNLSAYEKELVLTKAGLIAATDKLNISEAANLIQKNASGIVDAKALMLSAGLVTKKQIEKNATIQLTAANIEEAMSKGLLSVADAKVITSALGVTGVNFGEAVSFDVLTKAIWKNIAAMAKWLVTNPLGWVILGTGAIFGLVKGIDALTESTEEAGEAATAAKERYNEIESEIDSLNSKIEENNKLIAETNGDAQYDGYRKRLEAENKELERQIELERIKAQEAKTESDGKATKVLTSETYEYDVKHTVNATGAGYTTTSQKGDIATVTDWYLDQAEATGVVSDKLKDYIETIKEQRENLDLLNPESKELYDNLGLLIDRYIALYPNVKVTSDEMADSSENANKMTVSLSDLEKTSDNIKTLASAFKELSEDGYISTKTLGEIQTATGLSGDEWIKYENRLLNAKKGSAEFNQVLKELTYKTLDAQFAKIDYINATDEEIKVLEDKIALALKENGVLNSSAVAHDYVAKARKDAAFEAVKLKDITYEEAEAFINEALSGAEAEQALAQLQLAQLLLNTTKLNFDDNIDQIIAYANAALAADEVLDDLARAKVETTDWFVGPPSPSTQKMLEGTYDFNFKSLNPDDFKVSAPKYTTKDPSSKDPSGTDSTPNHKDPTDAVLETINLRQNEIAQDIELIEKNIDLAKSENDYAKAIALSTEALEKKKSRIEALGEANDVINQEMQALMDVNPWDEASWFDSQGNATQKYYFDYNNATKEEQSRIENVFNTLSKFKQSYLENEDEAESLGFEIIEDGKDINSLYSEGEKDAIDDILHQIDLKKGKDGDADVREYYERIRNIATDEIKRLYGLGFDDNDEEIQEFQKLLLDAEQNISDENDRIASSRLDEVKALFDTHQDSSEFIADLRGLLDGLDMSDDKRLEIEDMISNALREAPLDAVNDIEHQIEMNRDKYGDSFDASSYYDEIARIANEEIQELYNLGFDDNSDEVQKWQKTLLNAINDKENGLSNEFKDRIEDFKREISLALDANPNADVSETYDEMISAYQSEINRLKALDPVKYADNIDTLEDELLGIINDKENGLSSAHKDRVENFKREIEIALDANPNADVSGIYDAMIAEYQSEINRLKELDPVKYADLIASLEDEVRNILNDKEGELKKAHNKKVSDIEFEMELALEDNPFADTTEYYNRLQEEYHEEAERLRAIDPVKYAEDIRKLQKQWIDAENKKVDWRWNNSRSWIDQRNKYNDWALFGDTEVAAWERVVKWLNEEYPNDLDKIRQAEEALFDARKKEFSNATSYATSYFNSQKTLLQSHYNVINSISEAQNEINKELVASQTMYEYLDEDSRKLLFNQEDYNSLSRELVEIQRQANILQNNYQYDLENATLDTIEDITSNYQMQYETLMKSYEIAKAELEVAKKRQQLDNVLNERNVRMFIGGQWQWVANTQDVINAQSELADAEYAKRTANATLEQTKSINDLTRQQNQVGVVISKFESGVIDLNTACGKVKGMFDELPEAIENSIKVMQGITPKNEGVFTVKSNRSNATAWVPGLMNVGVYIDEHGKTQSSLPENSIVHTSDGDYKIIGGTAGDYKSIRINKRHAKGTKNTSSGNALMGENGFEAYIDGNHLIPIVQPTLFENIGAGGVVFNTDQMNNLKTLWDWSNITMPNYGALHNNALRNSIINNDHSYHVHFQNLEIDSGVIDIDALKRYIGNH